MRTQLRNLKWLPGVVLTLALLWSAGSQAAYAAEEPACYREIASIDYSGWSEGLEANRFRHVFQHVEEYPYFQNIGGAFIGIKTARYFPDGTVPNRSYWTIVDGRKGVGAEDHYSLIEDIRGVAEFSGVSVNVNVHDEFAFFLYDRSATERFFYYAHVAKEGLLDVMTTTDNGTVFIDVVKSSNWRTGQDTALRLWSARFNYREDHRGRHFEWNDGYYDEKQFRTIFFVRDKVVVGGVEHDRRKICRQAWSPLVVTNSDKLVPAVEEELRRRGDRIHALRVTNEDVPATDLEARSWFDRLDGEAFVKVAEVRKDHTGDFRQNSRFGEIGIIFTRDLQSEDLLIYPIYDHEWADWRYWLLGRLYVDGQQLGAVTEVYVGVDTRGAGIERKLKRQSFKTIGEVEKLDDAEIRCHDASCNVLVKRKRLRLK